MAASILSGIDGSRLRPVGAAIALAWIAAFPSPIFAQTVTDAMSQAYERSPELRAERAAARATDERVPQALSNFLPTAQAAGGAGYEKSIVTGGNPFQDSFFEPPTPPSLYSLSITQPLFHGGANLAQLRSARHTVGAEDAHLVSVEQKVLLAAVTDYLDVVRDQSALRLNDQHMALLREQLKSAHERFSRGELSRADVAETKASYYQAVADRGMAASQLEISRSNYLQDVGDTPGELTLPPEPAGLPTSENEALETSVDSNPDIGSARLADEAADDNIHVALGDLWPTVTLAAQYQREFDASFPGEREDFGYALIKIVFPFYSGGAESSKVRQARQQSGEQRFALEQAVQKVQADIQRAWANSKSGEIRVDSYAAQVRSNDLALVGIRKQREAGELVELDVLNAQYASLKSQVDLVSAQHDLRLAQFTLLAAVGRLTATHLDLPVERYDPSVNRQSVSSRWYEP